MGNKKSVTLHETVIIQQIFQVTPKTALHTFRIEIPFFKRYEMFSLFCDFWIKKICALSKKLDFTQIIHTLHSVISNMGVLLIYYYGIYIEMESTFK